MSEAQHTPGPWKICEANRFVIERDEYGSHDNPLATAHYQPKGDIDANARLIATAPALLKACQRVLRAIEWSFPRDRLTDGEQAEELKAVIAQATSEGVAQKT